MYASSLLKQIRCRVQYIHRLKLMEEIAMPLGHFFTAFLNRTATYPTQDSIKAADRLSRMRQLGELLGRLMAHQQSVLIHGR